MLYNIIVRERKHLYKIKHLIKEKNIMANKFKEKQILAELLNDLYVEIDSKEQSTRTEYRITGKEEEQAKDWRSGELLWEDEEKTIPKFKDKWENVPKESLSEDDEIRVKMCQYIKTQLEKMI